MKALAIALILAAAVTAAYTTNASAQDLQQLRCRPQCCTAVAPCYTSLSSGPLQIRISGVNRNTAEIYFGEAEYAQYAFPAEHFLCASHFMLAPQKNDFGAFLVRSGKTLNTVTLFGRIPRTEDWTSTTIEFPEGAPLSLEWVTSRILRIRHGGDLKSILVIRLDEADDAWKQLSPKPSAIGSVKRWNAATLAWE